MILWKGFTKATSVVSLGNSGTCNNHCAGVSPGAAQVWTPVTRVGDVGGMLGGSVGANLLGFAGACLSPDGKALLGMGYGVPSTSTSSIPLLRKQTSHHSVKLKPARTR